MCIKKISASLLLFFLTATLPAQEKFAEYHLSPEQLVTRNVKLLTDDNGNLLADIACFAGNSRLLLIEGDSPKLIYQDSIKEKKKDDAITAALKKVQAVRNLQRLATAFDNGIYSDCYYSGKEESAFFVDVDAVNKTATVTDTVKMGKDEHIITVLEDSGAVYLLSYLDKSDVIYIHVKKPGSKLRIFEKTIKVSSSVGRRKKGVPVFSDFFKEKNGESYFVYDNRHPNPSYLSAIKEKIYHFPGKLIFSLENYNLQTNLVTLDLKSLTHDYYAVAPPFPFVSDDEPSIRSTSSFLSNDILFKTGRHGDIFFISATNIYTGALYYSFVTHTNKSDSIVKTPFFSSATYSGLADGKKKSLNKYLDIATIGIIPAGDNLFDIEISSLYQSMGWGHILLSVATSVTGTYLINSIPNTIGYSIFLFRQRKVFSIRNTLDISTGKFVGSDTAAHATESWEQKVTAVNKFIEQYEYREDKAQAVIAGKTIYVYFVEPAEEKLLVYKF